MLAEIQKGAKLKSVDRSAPGSSEDAPKASSPQDMLMAEILEKAKRRKDMLKPVEKAEPIKRERSFASVLRERMKQRLKSMNADGDDDDGDDDEWK